MRLKFSILLFLVTGIITVALEGQPRIKAHWFKHNANKPIDCIQSKKKEDGKIICNDLYSYLLFCHLKSRHDQWKRKHISALAALSYWRAAQKSSATNCAGH